MKKPVQGPDGPGVPSLSDYTPRPPEEIDLQIWSGRTVIAVTVGIILLLIIVVLAFGFHTAQQVHPPAVSATAHQTAADTIVITYGGGPDAASLVLLTATVTSYGGNVQAKSIGQERNGAPPPAGSTLSFTGPYGGRDRVVVTAVFSGGQSSVVLDTTI